MKRIIYTGNYLKLSEENINNHIYERVMIRNGVRVIPIKDNKILFIKEYKPHENKSSIKLISGWMDKEQKSPLLTAKEELIEEVSMQADKWNLFYKYDSTNSTVEETVFYFTAKKITTLEKQDNPDNDIVEEIIFLSEKDFVRKLEKKEIQWGKDIAVLFMLFRKIRRESPPEYVY